MRIRDVSPSLCWSVTAPFCRFRPARPPSRTASIPYDLRGAPLMQDLVFLAVIVVVFAVLALIVRGGREAVSAENIVGLVVACGLLGYLVLALIFPEKF